jgi:hypothetical protein
MDKAAKIILNSLKCPVCKGQIDLFDWNGSTNKKTKQHNFCCAADQGHYQIWFAHWDSPPQISQDQVQIYDGKRLYRIRQIYTSSSLATNQQIVWNNATEITIWDVDPERRIIILDSKNQKTTPRFDYNKVIFDWQKIDRDKIINKIKTILTFQ